MMDAFTTTVEYLKYLIQLHFARAHFKGPSEFIFENENALEPIILQNIIKRFLVNALYTGIA